MKGLVFLIAVIFAVGYFVGFTDDVSYSRVVGKPPADVARGLYSLDIGRDAPGGVGTDPSQSGGVLPEYRVEQAPGQMSWYVMSGEKVATKMTAHLEPLENGTQTRVTAKVERGDAPDDFVSPAFRSEKLTLGLFTMALETRLNRLTAPPPASRETCEALIAKLQNQAMEHMAMSGPERPDNLKDAVGQTSASIVRIGQMEAELRRAGCKTDGLVGR